jgi:hypothetical protein
MSNLMSHFAESMRKTIKKWATFTVIGLISTTVLTQESTAQEDFLTGFPDVPQLDIISEIVGEPVVFDTASGTVAEARLKFSINAPDTLKQYGSALTALGWTCKKTKALLKCEKEENQVSLSPPAKTENTDIFILRLEPRR